MLEKQTVNAKSLQAQLSGKQAPLVIDLRDGDSYLLGHIPGAMNIPIKRLEMHPGSIPNDRPVVLYGVDDPLDALYGESLRVMRESGIEVSELEGGLQSWMDAGFPLERENNKTYDNIDKRPDADENTSIAGNKD